MVPERRRTEGMREVFSTRRGRICAKDEKIEAAATSRAHAIVKHAHMSTAQNKQKVDDDARQTLSLYDK